MTTEISKLIESGQMEEASALLAECLKREGFNDTLAIFAASINAYFGDQKNCLESIENGLKYNPQNYELHLMKGDYFQETETIVSLNEYETALNLCEFEAGSDSPDYLYIRGVFDSYKQSHLAEIEEFCNNLPILIYKSEAICYGVLNHFADSLAVALEGLGQRIEIIDVTESKPEILLPKLCGKRYKAILGIQTYMFSVAFNDGRCAHDYIFGPKFNMLFDHPACMYNHFPKGPKDYIILTHDRNYREFILKYYPNVKDCKILPPAGEIYSGNARKEYGFSFVGTYHDPQRWWQEIEIHDSTYGGRVKKLVDYMTNNPDETYETALEKIFGADFSLDLSFTLKCSYFYVMSLYRERTLKAILDAGIILHVFGDSWDTPKWQNYKNLIRHGEVAPKDSIEIYGKSLASLNIMSWHKDGRTERVANMMLNRCVVVSDSCDYLSENYINDEEIILFGLKDVNSLPKRIENILGNREKCYKIAQRVFDKACKEDIWEKRAGEFLDMVTGLISVETE